ncbi:hypothetical protein PIB30_062689 [Stylosanthes scabra]|uniref:E3 ubiquitin-protein ligase LIN-1 n=1 Tax=Stylosanthes scabra TaxID=79078 RepID=A0ABU6YNS1_9FABA|nr:hypothetical protein [Stylosanthes scabra]
MIDLKFIWVLVSINRYILETLSNERTRNALKLKCTSKLRIQKQEFFEFSEQSVLSNLYWGIDSIEAAFQAQQPEEKSFRLMNSEQMLQVPAMLDEDEVTATVSNRYLVCCSYFYLSVVRNLQGDEWQSALHFLQAVLVSPNIVCNEFASELCQSLFPQENIMLLKRKKKQQNVKNNNNSGSMRLECSEDEVDEAIRDLARSYKEGLVYYQVMLYGENPWWRSYCSTKQQSSQYVEAPNTSLSTTSFQHEPRLKTCNMYDKVHSLDPQDVIHNMEDRKFHIRAKITKANDPQRETYDRKLHAVKYPRQEQLNERSVVNFGSNIFNKAREDSTLSISSFHVDDGIIEEALQPLKFHLFDNATSKSASKHWLSQKDHEESSKTKSRRYSLQDLSGVIERISELHYSEALGKCGQEYTVDIASIYEYLTDSSGTSYASLRDAILDELLVAISTSKEEREIRASVSILTTIISRNKSVIEDIKKKGLKLCDLASALKQNVHEAAILIYLINPSPIDIKTLELLPILVEIVCTSNSYKNKPESLLLTPHAASLMIIEELVTSFDYATNNMHLAAISSPHVLSGLLEVARNDNLEEFFSLTTILIKCMQFDAQCRQYVSQYTPLAPFIHLLQTENTRAKCMALEFFQEILCIPRSSAITLLQRIQQEGGINFMQILRICAHQLQPDHQLFAANILLQLETLNPCDKSLFREEAVKVLLRALVSQESSEQILSASILSNLAGTYAWTGEPYTAAWLLRKTGLNSPYHHNMIRNFNWLDQSLQDTGTDLWCSKIAKCVLSVGDSIFHALESGLRSKMKMVSRDCLVAISWLGCQISKSSDSLRYSASEIILSGIEQFLHPGMELEERLLACLCIYNYATGKGKQKLIHFSEGVKESLRRLSNVTWMAEELHKVADFLLPNISSSVFLVFTHKSLRRVATST